MRHPGSPRIEDLPIRSAPWLPIVGGVAFVVGVLFVIGAVLLGRGVHTAEVSALARRLPGMSAHERGGRQAADAGSAMGWSADIAATSDNGGATGTYLPSTGAKGALHAGDRSPFAVSNRRDLRLDLMEMMAWRSRQNSSFLGSCLFC